MPVHGLKAPKDTVGKKSSHLGQQSTQPPATDTLQRAAAAPDRMFPADVLRLQHLVGNHALTHLVKPGSIGKAIQPRRMTDPCKEETDMPAQTVFEPGVNNPALVGRMALRHPAVQARSLDLNLSNTSLHPRIQRWGLKAGFGLFGASGHEALTKQGLKQAMEDDSLSDEQKKELKSMSGDIKSGSRWNDMLHNNNIAQMGVNMHTEGTLTNLSHEGELSAIHAMAASVGEQAWQTRHKIMMWAEFCYKVATGTIAVNTYLGDVATETEKDFEGGPTIKELFKPWAQSPVGWLFTGSKKFTAWDKAKGIALGSMMHMLQDSFCQSHAQREMGKRDENKARLIKGFNAYPEQSSNPLWGNHGKADAVLGKGGGRFSGTEARINQTAGAQEAVDISATVLKYFATRMPWDLMQTFLQSQLGLTQELEDQAPKGDENGKKQWDSGNSETGNRITSASGRLFRKKTILNEFTGGFGWAWTHPKEPNHVRLLRDTLQHYDGLLTSQVNNVNKIIPPELMLQILKAQKLDIDWGLDQAQNSKGAVNSLLHQYYSDKKIPQLMGLCNTIMAHLKEDLSEVSLDITSIQAEQKNKVKK